MIDSILGVVGIAILSFGLVYGMYQLWIVTGKQKRIF